MEKSIRVRILGRDYPLRVRPEDEAVTRDMAAYVDGKMSAFKQAHPEQQDLVAAVVAAMALVEELYTTRAKANRTIQALEDELEALDAELAQALAPAASNGQAEATSDDD